MKGIRLQDGEGLGRLIAVDLADPGMPGPGEMRVRINASSLNFHDYLVVVRGGPATTGRVPLADGAGVVEAIGADVSEFKVGDHVVSTFSPTWLSGEPFTPDMSTVPGDGVDGYAREVVVRPATWFTLAPNGWSDAQAATLPTAGVTAWRSLMDGGLKAGDVVLTMGSGGVALFALQIAKAMGALVIATSSSDEKLEKLKAMGADHVINYRQTPEWGTKVRELAGGRGADIVIEIGGVQTMAQSYQAVRVGGHIALIGILAGAEGSVPLWQMLARQIRLIGVGVGSRQHQMDMVRGINATQISPVIDSSFPLPELAAGFEYLVSGQQFGKVGISL